MDRSNVQTRELTFDISERAADEGIPVVISSNDVVEVMDGPEILVHDESAIDLRRAPLPIIATHNSQQVNIGLVDGLRVENGRLKGRAMFGKRPEAAGYREDVLGGIIRSVSVGYARIKAKLRSDGVLVTSRWMPSHVAMVAEPADVNAGFFRHASELPALEIEPEEKTAHRAAVSPPAAIAAYQEDTMSDSTNAAAGVTAEKQVDVQVTADFDAVKRNVDDRAVKVREIANMCGVTDEQTIRHWMGSPKSIEDISREGIKIMSERSKYTDSKSFLDLTPAETKRFSIVKAIRAVVEQNWKEAGFEAEVSRTIAQRTGQNLHSTQFMIPADVTYARTLNVGTASLGGNIVGTDLQSSSFIDLLRNRSVAYAAGARSLSGLVGMVQIPRQAAAGAAAWIGELGTATNNTLTLSQITMSPKHIAGFQQYSRQLMLQSTPDIENLIQSDLARVLALGLDTAVLAGTSTDASVPLGIRFTSGLGTANPTAGTAVTYGDMIKYQSTVAAANALFENFTYVCHPAIAAVLMGKPRFTNSDTPIWEGGLLDGRMVGQRAMSSVQITSGTVLAGDFSQVLIGEWGSLAVEVNPTQVFQAGIVGVRAMWSVDVAVRYGSAFAFGTGITG